ncbi:MAG: lyase [Rhodothermales bacterium]|nr:lyase [Rhodothermales bacterium]
MRWLLLILVMPLFWVDNSTVQAQEVNLQEWEVPWESSRPRDPYIGPDGNVWFVGQRSDYIGMLDQATGQFKKYDLPAGAGPHNCIVDEEGFVWYSGNRAANIGRLDPSTGDIEIIPMPDPAARDPHTLIFDSEGDIWFTVQGGNYVGKLTVASRKVDLIKVPTEGSRPYGIVIDENDRPWFLEFGSYKIATVDPQSMELEEIDLPRTDARPRRLGITTDQNLWYVDYAGGYLGKYDPSSGEFEEWQMPSGVGSRPYGVAVDDQDRIWFVETGPQPNRFVGFDPGTQQFFSINTVESGGGTIRHMYFNAPTREIWFGADSNTIGRAKLTDAGL